MKDKAAVISRIHTLMEFWGIKPEDLEGDVEVDHTAVKAAPSVASQGPKYAHPKTGEVWDGEGMQPQWLKDAVLKEGYLVEELRKAALEKVQQQQQQNAAAETPSHAPSPESA